ncbi:hypothetical protein GCM10027298_27310 [Epidermidibacterium keratini]
MLVSRSKPYHRGNVRESLLSAATTLLDEKSVEHLSLREVARAADVSHAAPYHYFSDRGELLKATGDECMRALVEKLESAPGRARDPLKRLAAICAAYVDFAAERPHAFTLVFDGELCPPGDPSAERAPLIERSESLLYQAVSAAQQDGWRSTAPTLELTNGIWATAHGLATLVTEGHLTRAQAADALGAVLRPS